MDYSKSFEKTGDGSEGRDRGGYRFLVGLGCGHLWFGRWGSLL